MKEYFSPKKFNSLKGTKGFSDKALETHFALYEGYVANVNKIMNQACDLSKEEKGDSPEFAELKRRWGWEFNGMRLHEIYFSSFKKDALAPDESLPLIKKLAEDYGSFENWQKDFVATAMMRGIGWAILYYDAQDPGKNLLNVWINEHDVGHLATATPLLPIDVFEHAFLIDYGTSRKDYVDAFLAAVDWEKINERFEAVEA